MPLDSCFIPALAPRWSTIYLQGNSTGDLALFWMHHNHATYCPPPDPVVVKQAHSYIYEWLPLAKYAAWPPWAKILPLPRFWMAAWSTGRGGENLTVTLPVLIEALHTQLSSLCLFRIIFDSSGKMQRILLCFGGQRYSVVSPGLMQTREQALWSITSGETTVVHPRVQPS